MLMVPVARNLASILCGYNKPARTFWCFTCRLAVIVGKPHFTSKRGMAGAAKIVSLDHVDTWEQYFKKNKDRLKDHLDGAIHRAAGPELKNECRGLGGCEAGDAKITKGYKLPAKHVIHTVGPQGEKPGLLKSCYDTSLNILVNNNLRTVAFPCISTGVYGYPQNAAANVALKTVRSFLEKQGDSVDRVIFCLFLEDDVKIYEYLLQAYFPVE